MLEVREWSKIHDVKNLIKGVEGIAPERQRLFFRGREVDNSWCVASAEDGCTLFCVIKPSDASQRYAAKINLCTIFLYNSKTLAGMLASSTARPIFKFEAIACSRRLRWDIFPSR